MRLFSACLIFLAQRAFVALMWMRAHSTSSTKENCNACYKESPGKKSGKSEGRSEKESPGKEKSRSKKESSRQEKSPGEKESHLSRGVRETEVMVAMM